MKGMESSGLVILHRECIVLLLVKYALVLDICTHVEDDGTATP